VEAARSARCGSSVRRMVVHPTAPQQQSATRAAPAMRVMLQHSRTAHASHARVVLPQQQAFQEAGHYVAAGSVSVPPAGQAGSVRAPRRMLAGALVVRR